MMVEKSSFAADTCDTGAVKVTSTVWAPIDPCAAPVPADLRRPVAGACRPSPSTLDKKVERVFDGGLNLGSFLLDGFVAGAWCTEEKGGNSDDRAPSSSPPR